MTLRKSVSWSVKTLLVVGLVSGVVSCSDDSGGGGGGNAVGGTSALGGGSGLVGAGGNIGTTVAVSAGGSVLAPNTGSGGSTVAPAGTFVTNLPSTATQDYSSTAAGAGLALRSLNIVTDTVTEYTQWFGEVVNDGTSLVCFPQANFSFKDASGVVLWTDRTYADTLPYLSASSTLSTSCLAAGEVGTFWTNELATITPSSVASLTIAFDGLVMTATKFAQTMTSSIVEDAFYQDGNHWAMSGSLTPSQTISNVGINVYTKSTAGLITGRLIDTNLNSIAASTAWAFDSQTGIEGAKPATLLGYDDFILGSGSSGFGLTPVSILVTDPVLAGRYAAARAAKQAARERHELATAAK